MNKVEFKYNLDEIIKFKIMGGKDLTGHIKNIFLTVKHGEKSEYQVMYEVYTATDKMSVHENSVICRMVEENCSDEQVVEPKASQNES